MFIFRNCRITFYLLLKINWQWWCTGCYFFNVSNNVAQKAGERGVLWEARLFLQLSPSRPDSSQILSPGAHLCWVEVSTPSLIAAFFCMTYSRLPQQEKPYIFPKVNSPGKTPRKTGLMPLIFYERGADLVVKSVNADCDLEVEKMDRKILQEPRMISGAEYLPISGVNCEVKPDEHSAVLEWEACTRSSGSPLLWTTVHFWNDREAQSFVGLRAL